MTDPLITLTRDPRLAMHATSAVGAWLWASDASRILWSNAAGAALVGAATPAALAERRFTPDQPLATQIARLAGSLPATGAPRLDRLRGVGGGVGGALLCSCSRLSLAEGGHAVLVVATEVVKPTLPLAERVQRLVAETDAPVAVYAADGVLMQASGPLRARLAGPLGELDLTAVAAAALESGQARGASRLGEVALHRLGAGSATVLLAVFAETLPEATVPAAAEAVAPVAESAPAPEGLAAEPAATADPADEIPAAAAPAAGEAERPRPEPETAETAAPGEPAAEMTEPAAPEMAEAVVPEIAEPAAPETAEPAAPVAETAPPAEAPAPAQDAEPVARPAALPEPPALPALARRSPPRFVWQIDAEGRFTLATREFADVMGPSTLAVLGRSWPEIAAALALDPDQRVARAIASRDTWSGIAVAWPVDGSDERAQVELSGLPAFDRTRAFLGYRGFGVCREIARFADVIATRAGASGAPAAAPPPPAPEETVPVPTAEAGETETREAAPAPEERAAEARPVLTVVPPVQNVVPFRTAAPADRRPTLTAVEHSAFKQIAEALGGPAAEEPEAAPPAEAATPAEPVPPTEPAPAMEPAPTTEAGTEEPAADDWGVETAPVADADLVPAAPTPERRVRPVPSAFAPVPGVADAALAGADAEARLILERLPIAILVHRDAQLVYANRTFLEWTGYADLKDVVAAGGLDRLVPDGSGALDKANGTGRTFALATRGGGSLAAEGRLCTVPWEGAPALMLALTRTVADERLKSAELARGDAEREARELRSILDTATDGIIVIDREGRVLSINRSAEALFGYDYHEIIRKPFWLLFAPESERAARDYLDGLTRNGVASVLNDGREVIGRVQQGGLIPLFMTMGRVGDSGDKFCAVFRDITQWKRAEEDLTNAKREAERASSAKSDFLAKISHEIRTPLNAIIGFSEVMMEERFGNVGNERYRQYLNDIHTSGQHLVSLINDLLDLSKIEAGKLDLVFASVNLNELVQQCVALMQPQANRERIIIRTSLSPTLPPVVIDARSVRQIVLNLLSNSIKFTGAAGQVIVSTALTDRGEAVLRVRDTGVGMSEKEIETALEPFRQLSTSTRWGSGGTGLGLPLTKALAEANRATFAIKSAANAGTLVEITFPATRVLAE